MGRFRDPQDPLFQALNSSISFDFRLAPYDIEQSLAHARMLAAAAGSSAEDDLAALERGLERGPRGDRRGPLPGRCRTTRTCTWRSSGG